MSNASFLILLSVSNAVFGRLNLVKSQYIYKKSKRFKIELRQYGIDKKTKKKAKQNQAAINLLLKTFKKSSLK